MVICRSLCPGGTHRSYAISQPDQTIRFARLSVAINENGKCHLLSTRDLMQFQIDTASIGDFEWKQNSEF